MATVRIEIKQKGRWKTPKDKPSPEEQEAKEKEMAEEALYKLAFQQVKQAVGTAISVSASRYFNLMEDYQSEVVFNNAKTAVSKALSLGASAVAGFKIGGGVGAAIAVAGWGVTEMFNAIGTYNNAMLQVANTNSQVRFAQQRMSLIDGGRGTEN